MNRTKLFLENFFVYGLVSVVGKIIPFVMLPIITRLLPDASYFGINDLFNVIISFGQAIAILGMYDAMFRMFFEKESLSFKKEVCSTAFTFTLFTSFCVFIVLVVCKKWFSLILFDSVTYEGIIVLSAIGVLIGASNSIVSAPARMQNKRSLYFVVNIISAVISYSISIPLILKGHYLIALPLSAIIASFSIEVFFFCYNRRWFRLSVNKSILRQLLIIGVPLFPTFLIYWVYNSFDRIMITKMMGIEWAGVYAAGAKLGQASQLIYQAFAGGWQYFAFSTMRDDDQVNMISGVFEYLGIISCLCSVLVMVLSRPIYNLLFPPGFAEGYIVMPYLFFAPLLLMLYQVMVNQFLIIKKTWPSVLILSCGAVFNIIVNRILIPRIGIEGAALGTLGGYIISIIIVCLTLIKMKLAVVSRRFLVCVMIFFTYSYIWRGWHMQYSALMILFGIIFILICGLWYRSDIQKFIRKLHT